MPARICGVGYPCIRTHTTCHVERRRVPARLRGPASAISALMGRARETGVETSCVLFFVFTAKTHLNFRRFRHVGRFRVKRVDLLFVLLFDRTPAQLERWRDLAAINGEVVW